MFVLTPSGSYFHIAGPSDAADRDSLGLHLELAGRMAGLSVTTTFPLGVRLSRPLLLRMLGLRADSLAGFDDEFQARLEWLKYVALYVGRDKSVVNTRLGQIRSTRFSWTCDGRIQ